MVRYTEWLGKLTDRSHDWLMAFNVDKCKVMHIGRTNVHSKYYMNGAELGNTTEEKDLGVIVADNLMVAKVNTVRMHIQKETGY